MTNRRSSNAKQSWAIGEIVTVGFVHDLEVVRKNAGVTLLVSTQSDSYYTFQPYEGLCRFDTFAEAAMAL